jgi:uncharacterized protein YkwD
MVLLLSLTVAVAAKPTPRAREADAVDFWRQPALDAAIDPGKFDRPLLERAIFHETNRVRAALGLKAFLPEPLVDRAAELEAEVGRASQPPSHTNPFPLIGTPGERVKYVGLEAARVAENIALISIYDTGRARDVGIVVRDGRKHFVNPHTLEDLKPASYRLFAATVVQAWMDSPGHRANLVNPALTHLGCAVLPTVNINGVNNLFCVQVFFTPK